MYVVATYVRKLKDLSNPYDYTTYQVPTFFLREDVQGIVDEEHAKKIVEEIVNPTGDPLIQISGISVRKM